MIETPISRPISGRSPIWWPMALLFFGSFVILFCNLDIIVVGWFWSSDGGWFSKESGFINLMYHYGTLPGIIVGAGGAVAWVASFFVGKFRAMRHLTGFLALALLIGPGLLANVILKDHYGRPRPREVTEFGGQQRFRPLGEPTFDGHGKSFPSGHASMGFFWLAPGVYFWPRSRRLALGFIALGLLHGGLMGFGRMAQGAHWLSDILWSAGVVYLSAWGICRVLNFCLSTGNSATIIEGSLNMR